MELRVYLALVFGEIVLSGVFRVILLGLLWVGGKGGLEDFVAVLAVVGVGLLRVGLLEVLLVEILAA